MHGSGGVVSNGNSWFISVVNNGNGLLVLYLMTTMVIIAMKSTSTPL